MLSCTLVEWPCGASDMVLPSKQTSYYYSGSQMKVVFVIQAAFICYTFLGVEDGIRGSCLGV